MCRICPIAFCLLTLAAATGCVHTCGFCRPKPEQPPVGPAHQVHAAWENRVMVTQDVVNGGVPLVGIAGRLYLFGQEIGYPVIGEGSAVIDLYDVTPETTQGTPKMLERWEIDRDTLRRLARKDDIGWGYTLFLPWNTYDPKIGRVQLQARFLPDKGLPLYSKANVVAFRSDQPQVTLTTRQVPVTSKMTEQDRRHAELQTLAAGRPAPLTGAGTPAPVIIPAAAQGTPASLAPVTLPPAPMPTGAPSTSPK